MVWMSTPASSRWVAKAWRQCRYRHWRHYAASREMPSRTRRRVAASGSQQAALGIVSSPATLRGATGDDHDRDVRTRATFGARGLFAGIRADLRRADVHAGIRARVDEGVDPIGAGLRGLARSAGNRKGESLDRVGG